MTKVLVITSSASGEASVSNRLVGDTLAQLRKKAPELTVLKRDLDGEPLPHLSSGTIAALGRDVPSGKAARIARQTSDDLICELEAADIIVIGAPMYNFGIPSTLKAWFDFVLRAGVTFRYTENGSEGLLKGKQAIVIETRGGVYGDGPASVLDAQEPHLRGLLNFIGIEHVTFIRSEGLAMGSEPREQGILAAKLQLDRLFESELLIAA